MQSIEGEIWIPVVGFEGYYEVSDQGRVRSVERTVPANTGTRLVPSTILTPWVDPKGYCTVGLGKPGQKAKTLRVHRIVLEAFVGPRPSQLEACHGNGDPADNRRSNLRWDTHSANNLDRVKHGTHPLAARDRCLRDHALDEANTYVNPSGYRSCRTCRRVADNEYRRRAAERIAEQGAA